MSNIGIQNSYLCKRNYKYEVCSESHIHDLEVCRANICEDARSQGNLNLNRRGLTFHIKKLHLDLSRNFGKMVPTFHLDLVKGGHKSAKRESLLHALGRHLRVMMW